MLSFNNFSPNYLSMMSVKTLIPRIKQGVRIQYPRDHLASFMIQDMLRTGPRNLADEVTVTSSTPSYFILEAYPNSNPSTVYINSSLNTMDIIDRDIHSLFGSSLDSNRSIEDVTHFTGETLMNGFIEDSVLSVSTPMVAPVEPSNLDLYHSRVLPAKRPRDVIDLTGESDSVSSRDTTFVLPTGSAQNPILVLDSDDGSVFSSLTVKTDGTDSMVQCEECSIYTDMLINNLGVFLCTTCANN